SEDLAVEAVEALVVDLEEVERGGGDRPGHHAPGAYLGVVPHPLQEPICDAWGAAAALRDRDRPALLDRDVKQPSRAAHDRREVLRAVVLEAMLDAEAVAQ